MSLGGYSFKIFKLCRRILRCRWRYDFWALPSGQEFVLELVKLSGYWFPWLRPHAVLLSSYCLFQTLQNELREWRPKLIGSAIWNESWMAKVMNFCFRFHFLWPNFSFLSFYVVFASPLLVNSDKKLF